MLQISCASLHNDFLKPDKMQVNFQGVGHDLRRLYNNKDTQCVIQELGNKYMNKNQLCKLCFFNWEALAKDAVEQNLIPDDIFVSH